MIVMLIQDPLLFLVSFIVFPPTLLVLRKIVYRVRTVARSQFTGSTRTMETLQEMLQGIRIVKAFTLEDVARQAFRGQRRRRRGAIEQDGACGKPLEPAHGSRWRDRDRDRYHL